MALRVVTCVGVGCVIFCLGGDDVFFEVQLSDGFGIGWLVCLSCEGWMDDEPESLILAQSERWRHA